MTKNKTMKQFVEITNEKKETFKLDVGDFAQYSFEQIGEILDQLGVIPDPKTGIRELPNVLCDDDLLSLKYVDELFETLFTYKFLKREYSWGDSDPMEYVEIFVSDLIRLMSRQAILGKD